VTVVNDWHIVHSDTATTPNASWPSLSLSATAHNDAAPGPQGGRHERGKTCVRKGRGRGEPKAGGTPATPARYLTVSESAEYLNTSVRFVRRLVAERRIAFHQVGVHVRINLVDLEEFVQAGRVEAVTATTVLRDLHGVA
jgi:excisionase family DNA binding protein